MANPKIGEIGKATQWKPGQSGNPKGRPRRILKRLEKEINISFKVQLSREDKFNVLESMMEMSINELQRVAQDKDAPIFMVIIANALKTDISKGRMDTVNDLFDRFFGKAEQASKVQLESSGKQEVTHIVKIDQASREHLLESDPIE